MLAGCVVLLGLLWAFVMRGRFAGPTVKLDALEQDAK